MACVVGLARNATIGDVPETPQGMDHFLSIFGVDHSSAVTIGVLTIVAAVTIGVTGRWWFRWVNTIVFPTVFGVLAFTISIPLGNTVMAFIAAAVGIAVGVWLSYAIPSAAAFVYGAGIGLLLYRVTGINPLDVHPSIGQLVPAIVLGGTFAILARMPMSEVSIDAIMTSSMATTVITFTSVVFYKGSIEDIAKFVMATDTFECRSGVCIALFILLLIGLFVFFVVVQLVVLPRICARHCVRCRTRCFCCRHSERCRRCFGGPPGELKLVEQEARIKALRDQLEPAAVLPIGGVSGLTPPVVVIDDDVGRRKHFGR